MEVRERDDFAGVVTRLLSKEAAGKRVLRLDNIKTNRLSWAELEGFITGEVISGKSLYHGEGRQPNMFTVIITLNGGAFSKDMAQRSVSVRLKRPSYNPNWLAKVNKFIDENRWAMIGEIIGILAGDQTNVTATSRWALWEQQVLGRCDKFEECQTTIKKRSEEIDGDDDEAVVIEAFFKAKILDHKHNPEIENILIPTSVIGDWYSEYEKRPTKACSATNALKVKALKHLQYKRTTNARRWMWIGGGPTEEPVELGKAPMLNTKARVY